MADFLSMAIKRKRRKPVKSAAYSRTVLITFEQAARLVGSEARLREGMSAARLNNWRVRGVPPHIVLRLLLRRLEDGELEVPEGPDAPVRLTTPKPYSEMERKIRALYEKTGGRGPEWEALSAVVNAFPKSQTSIGDGRDC